MSPLRVTTLAEVGPAVESALPSRRKCIRITDPADFDAAMDAGGAVSLIQPRGDLTPADVDAIAADLGAAPTYWEPSEAFEIEVDRAMAADKASGAREVRRDAAAQLEQDRWARAGQVREGGMW
ncbi:MAG: hypothetical protein V4669_13925 [Pseudomonadota bacterium]